MEKAKEIFMYCIAGLVIVGEIVILLALIFLWLKGVSTENESIINLIYGLAIAYHSGFMIVLGYFFGSSKGSADKTKIMNGGAKGEDEIYGCTDPLADNFDPLATKDNGTCIYSAPPGGED